MKHLITYSWLILILLATACYESLDVNTDNVDQVDMPIKIAAPLLDGQLHVEYDSLVNLDDLDNAFIKFKDNRAYIQFDTLIDFYDQLSDFLGAADIDFSDATQYQQSFDMDVDVDPTDIRVVYWKDGNTFYGEDVIISPQDSFKALYGYNAVFVGIDETTNLHIDGYDIDREMALNLDYEIYKVEVRSGTIDMSISSVNLPVVTEDSLYINPSFRYTQNGEDTIISNRKAFEITHSGNKLPLGVKVKLDMTIGNLFTAQGDTFKQAFEISSIDTALSIDLAGVYYEGNGDNSIDIKIINSIILEAHEQKAIIPLPEKMNIEAGVNDLKFQQVQFNYGRDALIDDQYSFSFDPLGMLSDDLKEKLEKDIVVDGFYIKDPNIKLKMRSNLGFAAQLKLDNMKFLMTEGEELVTETGTEAINIFQAENPNSFTIAATATEDSITIDSTNSRIGQINLYDIRGFNVDYSLVINPEDQGHLPNQHNFFYLYDEDQREAMYDTKLYASAELPIAFRFNTISLETTQALDLGTLDVDDMLSLEEDDSLSLQVKLWTTNLPFDLTTQFYFGKTNNNGKLELLDSLFNSKQLLLPSSNEGIQDSVMWHLTLNKSRYDAIQAMDSIRLNVRFSMDDESYYHVEKGSSLSVGYKFAIAPSSATINVE